MSLGHMLRGRTEREYTVLSLTYGSQIHNKGPEDTYPVLQGQ